MPERAQNIGEVINSYNSFDSGVKAFVSFIALAADVPMTYINMPHVPEQVWWLKTLAVAVINAPLGLSLIYQIARTMVQAEAEVKHERKKLADEVVFEFQRNIAPHL